MRRILSTILFLGFLPAAAAAQSAPTSVAGREALDLLVNGIGFQTVAGKGQVPAYAAYLEKQMVGAGFGDADVTFTPVGETGYLTARFAGRDRTAKPIVLLGHMDVVAANPADWTRDPFKAVVEDGYVFGRGALDNKGDVSILVATLMKLKRAGWTPARDLVLVLTGDEETKMATTHAAAERFKGAALVLNADAGGGALDDSGKPTVYGLQAAEKVYGDFRLTLTDPGGHSSRPGSTNAIASMAAAVGRIAAYRFPVEQNAITKAYLAGSAPRNPGAVGNAMRDFAADPRNVAAAELLSSKPEFIGQVRTTCVPTQFEGGHAPNALPQRASTNINCRIFPGTSRASVQAKLAELAADPKIRIELIDNGTIEAGASPLDPKVMAAVASAVTKRAPNVPTIPAMEAGATDSMHFRARGVPSFGVSSVFMRPADEFAHGLNERLPTAVFDPGIMWWEGLLRELAGRA
jgi:acetylornithine deacetylase/succinyl-diaminopimelate desuccinylase-like protein